MNRKKIAEGVKLILEGIGEKIDRDGLRDTPQRVAEMYEEIFSGINNPLEIQAGISQEIADDLILIKNISFYSMCEHHLLPFFGKVHIAYIPAHNKVAGFSSITRLVTHFSHRLQIQERLTIQIAEALMQNLSPKGVAVFIEAQQLCVSMRGSKKEGIKTITQSIRGDISLQQLQLNGFIEPSD
jgi:GTP cyclohydrolase I